MDELEATNGAVKESTHSDDQQALKGYPDKVTSVLSNGLVKLYEPDLIQVERQLKELTDKQEILIEQLHSENLKLSWSQNSVDVRNTFDTIRECRNKLLRVKKCMRTLHEQSAKIKKRVIRLEQHVEKEMRIKVQQAKREEDLVSKPRTLA